MVATPLLAASLVLIQQIWIKDVLGETSWKLNCPNLILSCKDLFVRQQLAHNLHNYPLLKPFKVQWRLPTINHMGFEMNMKLKLSLGTIICFSAVGCDQSPYDKAADNVRDQTQQQAEQVRNETQTEAERVRVATQKNATEIREGSAGMKKKAESAADATESRGEVTADSLETRGEIKADELESDGERKADAIEKKDPK